MKFFTWVVATLVLGVATAAATETTVAVAANFSAAMREIATDFARSTGHRAVLAIGSTGKLNAQIRGGAPFDALLAADQRTPELLAADGYALPASRFTYATGRLVLWSAQPGMVDPQGAVLARGQFRRLAIADPKLAPYGLAAMDVLAALQLEARLRDRFVLGDSIGQAYLFVATGNAPLGFVSLSQVQKDGRLISGSAWIVPQTLYRPLRQDFVLLTRGADNAAALSLAQYLRSAEAHKIMRSHGYH
jgi:molybdate transport system substrate-binding protein